jgi:hypothetical protein
MLCSQMPAESKLSGCNCVVSVLIIASFHYESDAIQPIDAIQVEAWTDYLHLLLVRHSRMRL